MEGDSLGLVFVLVALGGLVWGIWSAIASGALRIKKIYLSSKEEAQRREQQEKLIAEAVSGAIGKRDYFLIEKGEEYHTEVITQARTSHWFSLIFGALGILVLIFSFVSYRNGPLTSAFLQSFAGTVIEAISAVFVVQARGAREAMQNFHETLREDQLIERMSDDVERDKLIRKILLSKGKESESNKSPTRES